MAMDSGSSERQSKEDVKIIEVSLSAFWSNALQVTQRFQDIPDDKDPMCKVLEVRSGE